jgi:hypothetical protein
VGFLLYRRARRQGSAPAAVVDGYYLPMSPAGDRSARDNHRGVQQYEQRLIA